MRQIGPGGGIRDRDLHAAAVQGAMDAAAPPMTGGLDFWDHLAATRAQEYAQEDILSDLILPDPPALPAAPGPVLAGRGHDLSLGDMSGVHGFSLAQSLDGPGHAEGTALFPTQPLPAQAAYPSSASGLAIDTAHLEAAAPFLLAPQDEIDTRRQSRRPEARNRARGTGLGSGRLAYRLQRIWLTPSYRIALKFGTPVLAACAAIAFLLSDSARRDVITAQIDAIHDAIIDRPEFTVSELQLPQMSPELEYTLNQKLDLDLPQSSFRLDLDALRTSIEALDWVRSADLRLLSGGVLALSVTERIPVILWRSASGLEMLDGEGVRVAYIDSRALRPELPIISGEGARGHVPEALELLEAASPLGERVRGLVRMGERRWDVVLDRDQRIRLPETGALAALERVVALHRAQDLLARDLLVADMRNPARPVLQIGAGALETLHDIRSQSEALQ